MPKYPPNECRGLILNALNNDYKCKKTKKLYKQWTFDDIYAWNLAQDKNEFLVVQCCDCSRFMSQGKFNRHCRDKHGAKKGDTLKQYALDLVNAEWIIFNKITP